MIKNVKELAVGAIVGAIAGEILAQVVVKPIKKKIKEGKNKAGVTIDGETFEGVVEGA